MGKLNFITLNAHGLGNRKKHQEVLQHFWYCLDNSPDVMFIQETHSDNTLKRSGNKSSKVEMDFLATSRQWLEGC